MPTKKKSKKRSRDTGDSSGPPKKRMKKVKNNSDSVRRSARNHAKPKEYWKIGEGHNENDDDSDTTYEPATRRTRSTAHTKKNKSKPKAKSKRAKPNKKTKTNKKASDQKRENEESSELSDHSATESVDTDANNNSKNTNNHNQNSTASPSEALEPQSEIKMTPKQRKRSSDIDLLSPHKPHAIRDLPQQIDAMISSQQNHSKAVQSLRNGRSTDQISKCLKSIKNVLIESESLHKTQTEITKRIASEFKDLSKNGETQRKELNKNIEESSKKYQALQRMFEENMETIYSKVEKIGQNTSGSDVDANNEYKVLYETSLKKIKMLNEDLMSVKQEMKVKNAQQLKEEKQRESALMEMENNKRKEMGALRSKYEMEINALKVELKCQTDEFHEYKQKISEQRVIHDNNQNLLIDNLKRENKALLTELAMYRQEQRTVTPNSVVHTPVNTNYKDYRKHIEDSPLNTRIQNELITISNTKELENQIKNMNEEMELHKKQLFAKKELIKEFQELLEKSHAQQKHMLQQRERNVKIMNMYQILTCTNIEPENVIGNMDSTEENQKEEAGQKRYEQFKCRTVHKDNDSMLEYHLSLEATDDNEVCDYSLISSHNLSKPLNESLESCITFYTKDAPLFLKGLIQQVFTQKQS
eukprot:532762_1